MSLWNRKNPVRNGRLPRALKVVYAWSRGIQAAERVREETVTEAHFTFRPTAADKAVGSGRRGQTDETQRYFPGGRNLILFIFSVA